MKGGRGQAEHHRKQTQTRGSCAFLALQALCIFCLRKPANHYQAWSKAHDIGPEIRVTESTGGNFPGGGGGGVGGEVLTPEDTDKFCEAHVGRRWPCLHSTYN